MAFDHIPASHQLDAMDWLAGHKVRRILTHGRPLFTKIEHNLDVLQKYIDYASGRITIMPGGGITPKNLPFITGQLKIDEAHGSKIVGDLS